jgi:hypothetical protein
MEEPQSPTTTEAPPVIESDPPRIYARKGEKKAPVPQDCPWCDYHSIHPPGLAYHIKGNHPQHWKGKLGPTLGVTPSRNKYKRKDDWAKRNRVRMRQLGRETYMRNRAKRGLPYKGRKVKAPAYRMGQSRFEYVLKQGGKPKTKEELKAERREYYKRYTARRRAAGLTAKGVPYKHPLKKLGRPRAIGSTCPVCEKTFTSRPNMTLHLRKVHKRSIVEFDDRRPGADTRAKSRFGMSATAALRLPRDNGMPPEPPPKKENIFNPLGVNFCPRCGCNIRNVSAAVQFGETT